MEGLNCCMERSSDTVDSRLKKDIDEALKIIISEEKTSGSFKFFMGLLLYESGYLDIPMGCTETVMFREGSRAVGKRVFEMLYEIAPEMPMHCLKIYKERVKAINLALREERASK